MHLSVYMAERKLTDEDVAREIGAARATVSRWRRRRIRPDWSTIEAIRVFSHGKITAEDWRFLEPSEPAESSATAEPESPQPA